MKQVFLLLWLIPACAHAQLSVQTYYNPVTRSVTVTDSATGAVIQSPNSLKVWEDGGGNGYPCIVTPDVTAETFSDGYDLIFHFNNTTGDTSGIGDFYVAGFRFDTTEVYVRDFHNDGDEDTLFHNPDTPSYYGGGQNYPRSQYAPVSVLGNDVYTVGVSFQYPLTDYKHDIFMRTESPGGHPSSSGKNWQVHIMANRDEGAGEHRPMKYDPFGDIRPEEERTYRISVRFKYRNDHCRPWLTLLEPYKNYFHQLYGDQVSYTRDNRPIAGHHSAFTADTSASNPYGFRGDYPRPDIVGYGPYARSMNEYLQRNGYHRIMLWTPTGVYKKFYKMNYTFKFTSHWQEGDTLLFPRSYGHNMGDATDSLQLVPQSGHQLGLWWGRSTTVMTDWDTTDAELLNPDDSVHIAKAFHELDLAVQAGATMIGLDAFPAIPAWDAYRWLQMLKEHAPGVQFVVEQGSADLLHSRAPFFYYSERLSNAHYLANYLLKGNEIWAHVRYDSAVSCHQEQQRVAGLGYVPVNIACDSALTPSNLVAAEGWYLSNPYPDLPDTVNLLPKGVWLNAGYENGVSYYWSTGETTSKIKVTSAGTYSVYTTNSYGCSFTDTVVVRMQSIGTARLARTGVEPGLSQEDVFTLYPNPAHTQIVIERKITDSHPVEVTIYDMSGRSVLAGRLSGQQTSFDIASLASGVYMVRVQSGGDIYHGKFTKQAAQ